MLDAGFKPDFPAEVIREVHAFKQKGNGGADRSSGGGLKPALRAEDRLKPELPAELQARDLRGLLWSSIDNDSSRDLDQVEYAEKLSDGTVRLLVGIADVDGAVASGSATDQHAAAETSSVYTGVMTFPRQASLAGRVLSDRNSLQDSTAFGRCPLLAVIRKTSPTPVQMALSATLNAGKPTSDPPRCWR